MKCPHCHHQNHLEIDLHADGFSTNLLECGECGALLITNGQKLKTIRQPNMSFVSDVAYA